MLNIYHAMVVSQLPDPGSDPGGFFSEFAGAIQAGKWQAVAALVAIAVVFVLRKFATKIPGKAGVFFGTNRGGAVLALIGGVVTALAQIVLSGQSLDLNILINGIVLGVTAAGGWTLVRRLVWGDSPPPAYPTP